MNDQRYILDWRGTQRGPWNIAEIETRLEAGEINSLYSIHVDGKWVVLREFLEQERTAAALARKQAQATAPKQSTSHLIQQTAQPTGRNSPLPPPLPPQPTATLIPGFQDHAQTPSTTTGRNLWIMLISVSALVIILAAVAGGYLFANRGSGSAPSVTEAGRKSSATEEQKGTEIPALTETALDDEEISEKMSPFVVQVSVKWKALNKKGVLEDRSSAGSGVHIEDDGEHSIFVTNRHVVDAPSNAKKIECIMIIKGKEIPFEVIAIGRYELDLAKLRVKRQDIGHNMDLKIATLEQLKPGQQCVAIGNALGAGISVTAGVISAFDEWEAGKYIRTDAAISSGNSGGGLFRKKDGCLIGITTLASRSNSTTAIQNFNLAIPMDYVLSDLFWDKLSQ
jgi:S1-C subfamily serine protease